MRLSRRTRRDERGATLLLFAMVLLFLLILVAFAIDLGQGRFQDRNNQQIVDLALLSAGPHLAGHGGTDGDVATNPYGACVAAVISVQTNASSFRPTLTDAEIQALCDPFYDPYAVPADTTGSACDPTDSSPTVTEVTVARGPYNLVVRYPIPDTEISDDRFAGGSGTGDGTSPCERMRISIDRVDDTAFAGVIGVDEVHTTASAVVIGTIEEGEKVVPAFLLLERFACDTLGNSVGGSSLGILVESVGDQPGRIHIDSDATGTCSNNTNQAGGVVAYGSPLPSGGTSLTLESAGSVPGVLSIVATGPRAAGGGGINVPPTPGEVISRTPVDDVYNDAGNPAIGNLHAAAYPQVASTANLGQPVNNGWIEVDCNLTPNPADIADVAAPNWFVNCPGGFTPPSATAITAPALGLVAPDTIVFSNDVSVPNGQVLDATGVETVVVRGSFASAGESAFPDAERFYVGNGVDVTNTGSLRIAAEGLPAPDGDDVTTVCDGEDTDDEQAEMVVFFNNNSSPAARALTISGTAALCETTVYLAGPNSPSNATFSARSITGGPSCSEAPCPATSTTLSNARWLIAGLVEWTAPNQFQNVQPPSPQGLEDLMFWSESERVSNVSSGGILVSSGVFVAPNMRVEMRSPATANPRNAQFIARQLFLFQGTLQMRPLPNDSIPIREPGSFTLIR